MVPDAPPPSAVLSTDPSPVAEPVVIQNAAPAAEPIWAFRLRRGLYISAAVTGVYIFTAFFFVLSWMRSPPDFVNVIGGSAMVATVVFALARSWYFMFHQMQARFSEWLVTFFAIACFNFALQVVFKAHHDSDQQMAIAFIMGLIALSTLIGSGWAWSAMRTLKIEAPRERFFMLARGWLLIVGMFGGVIFVLWNIVLIIGLIQALSRGGWRPRFSEDEIRMYALFAGITALSLPGLRVMWQIRRLEKSKT